ncbi:MAG TPA: CHAT domain-containing protein [Allosphingosinicella sp.]|nr:CHAT domain-containing protein [Allosphingosinicella sp.]
MRTKIALATLCWDAGLPAEGQAWAEGARDDARALFPPEHPLGLIADSHLAEFLLLAGRDGEAIEILLECLAGETLLTDRLIDGHSDLADLGAMRAAMAQLDLATLAVLRARAIGPDVAMRLTEGRLRFGGSGAALLAARRRGQNPPRDLGRALLEGSGFAGSSVVAATTLFQESGVLRRALALWTDSGCTLHDLGPAGEMDRALSEWSRAPWRPAGEAVEPLVDLLDSHSGSHSRLFWFPDNALALVPLAAMFTRRHRPIVERFAVVQSRDAYAALASAPPSDGGALLVGIGEFRDGAGRDLEKPLPSVYEEIASLARIYPDAVMLLDTAATADALALALESRPGIVHIATHGLSEARGEGLSRLRRVLGRAATDDPLQRSAIVLSGEADSERLLTARDLAQRDLESVRLFVLAACDSGVGLNDAAEGSLGFQAALHHAGVATILCSLWPIGDSEAPMLMSEFHRSVLAGAPPSVALQTAQLAAFRRGDNPVTWGGFILSGLDQPLIMDQAK